MKKTLDEAASLTRMHRGRGQAGLLQHVRFRCRTCATCRTRRACGRTSRPNWTALAQRAGDHRQLRVP
ncbi:hypothetical protein QJS66_21275 [Kocuria rhizophila]|nr:hypothetical protein QJS66_21275 [Kocuria rhizophila]